MIHLQYLKDVVTLEYDVDKCIGCGMCELVCPHAVFVVERGKARITDRDLCMECGACQRNCPVEAISVRAGVGCAANIIARTYLGLDSECSCSTGIKNNGKKDNKDKKSDGNGSCGCC